MVTVPDCQKNLQRSEACLELSQTSTMERFCKNNSSRLICVNYFYKKDSSQMFDGISKFASGY